MIYKDLKQSEIFFGVEEKTKYEKSALTKKDAAQYLEKLNTYMENEKPYLNPTLSLNELSAKLSIPPRHLSQVVYESLNQNFFDFINSYRIREAKNIVVNSFEDDLTVLEILFQVGFNSESAFNYAFKRHTGMIPTEYRKLHHS